MFYLNSLPLTNRFIRVEHLVQQVNWWQRVYPATPVLLRLKSIKTFDSIALIWFQVNVFPAPTMTTIVWNNCAQVGRGRCSKHGSTTSAMTSQLARSTLEKEQSLLGSINENITQLLCVQWHPQFEACLSVNSRLVLYYRNSTCKNSFLQ